MWFRCSGGNGTGDGATITVTYSSEFYGATITATNGSVTLAKTATSTGSVDIIVTEDGIWTISAPAQGQTFSTTATVVLEYTAQLSAIPDGSTVTPINDIQIWLHCGNIWDKNYTTISQVLSDTTTLLALISSNNAADYMARSTSWATDVCSDSTAMTYIGNNDYCANALLSDSTWASAICNSTYFESVLNVKVPTMTSDTTPSGIVTASSQGTYTGTAKYKAFDNNDNTWWSPVANQANTSYIQYKFPQSVKVYAIYAKAVNTYTDVSTITQMVVSAGDDESDLQTIGTYEPNARVFANKYVSSSPVDAEIYRVTFTHTDYSKYLQLVELQFYGRTP